jgi:4-amino-4-deoxy-L-arabinose transferase-like glycosyltransferase
MNLLVFAISLIPFILYIYIAGQRIGLPFDVEWAEGAAVNQVNQILSGNALYLKPTVHFSPLVYTPLYYYVSSAVAVFTNDVLFSLRLVSVVSSFGSAAVIFWLVKRETGNSFAGWLSGILFLACFELSNGFYDLARVDSFYILITLLVLTAVLTAKRKAGLGISGVLFAVAFFTKQSALIVFFPLIIYFVFFDFKRTWIFLAAAMAGIGIPLLLISANSNGWFGYYIFMLPKEHGYSIIDAINFWVGDTLRPLGIAMGFLVLNFLPKIVLHRNENGQGKDATPKEKKIEFIKTKIDLAKSNTDVIYLLFVIGAFLAAWITRSSNGGGSNNSMSAYAALAIMFGLGYDLALQKAKKANLDAAITHVFISTLVIIQLVSLTYNPFNYIPTKADRAANLLLLELIDETPGEVLIPYRSHLPGLVNKETYIHVVNLFEITGYFHGEIQPEGHEIINEIRQGICEQKYSVIILDQPVPWFGEQISGMYGLSKDSQFEIIGTGSREMLWQDGLDHIYFPIEEGNPESCYETY